jgi:hypothetical protein
VLILVDLLPRPRRCPDHFLLHRSRQLILQSPTQRASVASLSASLFGRFSASVRSGRVFSSIVPLQCCHPVLTSRATIPRFGSSFNARPWISSHVCAPAQAAIFPFLVFLTCGARRLNLVLYRSPFRTHTDFSVFCSRSCPVQLLTHAPDRL